MVVIAALIAAGAAMTTAAAVAVLLSVAVCMLTVSGLTAWQWLGLVWRWSR
jgi:hypothetical protein